MSANCKSCGAEIIWATSVNDKPIPLDAKPEKRLILVFHRNVERGDYNEARMVDTYVSHFASCPDAAQHRKRASKEQ
jgi:hypothetical protein